MARLSLFGPFRLHRPDGASVIVPSRRARGLIAFLVLAPDRMATRERLCGLFWSDRGESQARASLRQVLLELRGVLLEAGLDILDVGRERIALLPAAVTSDLDDLAAGLEGNDAAPLIAALDAIGPRPLLEDLEIGGLFGDWLDQTRAAQDHAIAAGVHACLRALAEAEDWPTLLDLANAYGLRDPTDETVAALAIRGEAFAGSPAGARRRFEALRAALAREVGAEPGAAVIAALGEATAARTTSPVSAPPAAPADLRLPNKPSIAILPFSHLGDETGHDYFVDGMREEITNALTHFPTLFVIASGSVHGYPPGSRDMRAIGRELGVRYLMEGTVQKAGGRVRIAVKLVSAADGAQIWTQRFDDSLGDVFALQDRVAHSVAGALDSTLETAEIHRASVRPAADLDAYDLYLRALPLTRAWGHASAGEALALLEAAVERDPTYAPALMLAGFTRSQLLYSGWAEDPADCHRRGLDHCRRALQLAPQDPLVLSLAVTALMALGEDVAECARLAQRALEINPGAAGVLFASGWVHAVHGDPELAISRIEESLRLDPRTPMRPFQLTGKGMALFALRRFEDAIDLLTEITEALPEYPVAHIFLGASLAHTGRLAEARTTLAGVEPAVAGALTVLREPERRALLLEGLSLAGAAPSGSAAAA
jgi:TolB-like protein